MSPTDEYRKFQEESYFDKKNREALERLAKAKEATKPRLSPISGEPMEQVTLHGVVVDRCAKSGGIWLDAGELEQLIEIVETEHAVGNGGILKNFFKALTGS